MCGIAEKPYFKRFSGIEKVHRNSIKITVDLWCEKRDLNPYGVNHTPLKRARLPVPPLSHYAGLLPDCLNIISVFAQLVNPFFNLFNLFEKRIFADQP